MGKAIEQGGNPNLLDINYLLRFPELVDPKSSTIVTLNPEEAIKMKLTPCRQHPASQIQLAELRGEWLTVGGVLFGEVSPFYRKLTICVGDGTENSRHVLAFDGSP